MTIYHEDFILYLKNILGNDKVKEKSNAIVICCPWCYNKSNKNNFKLYISKEIPVFHCFRASCNKSGKIDKLFKKLEGIDKSSIYVNKELIKNNKNYNKQSKLNIIQYYKFPIWDINKYELKLLYLKSRLNLLKISEILQINNLVLDISEFIKLNNIELSEKDKKILPFISSNFVGYLTKYHSILFMRNIDSSSKFSHYKLKLNDNLDFLDYYLIEGDNKLSNNIVLAEGIYDIYSEYLYNSTGNKYNSYGYFCSLKFSYDTLIKSIAFNENIFEMNISILSDTNINLNYYIKLKKKYKHLINHLTVYYNKCGKDFNTLPIRPEKFII